MVGQPAMNASNTTDALDINGIAFFGRSLEKFQDLALRQTEAVFERVGVVVPSRSCSLLLAIRDHDRVSASDLSQILGYSHQRVLQKIPKLRKLGLISTRQDDDDARRRIFELTQKGEAQAKLLEKVLPAFAEAYQGLFREVGNIDRILSDALAAISTHPLGERIKLPDESDEKSAKRAMNTR